ncbi:MAG: DNRLRE domain-containing protein, partial [bacterium]
AFADCREEFKDKIGYPFDNDNEPDNNNGIYVHQAGGVWVQDYKQPDMSKPHFGDDGKSCIILNEEKGKAYLVREGFWGKYKEVWGFDNLRAPNGNEFTYTSDSINITRQEFQKGYMEWQEGKPVDVNFGEYASKQVFQGALIGGSSSDNPGNVWGSSSMPESLLPENIQVVNVWDRGCEFSWEGNEARGFNVSVFDYEIPSNVSQGMKNGCVIYLPHPDAEYPIRVISYDGTKKTEPIIVKTLPRLKGSPSSSNDLPYLSIYPDTQLWLETACNLESFGIIQQFKFAEATDAHYTNLSYEDAGGIDGESCIRIFNRYKNQRGTLHLERVGLELEEETYYVGSFYAKAEKDYTLVIEVALSIYPYGEQAYFNGTSRYQYLNIGKEWKKYVFMFKTENPDRDPKNIAFKLMIGDLEGYLWIDSPYLKKVSDAELRDALKEETTAPPPQEYILQPGPEDGEDMYMQLANVNNPANSPINKWELRVGGWGEYDRWNTFLKFNLTGLPQHAEKAIVWLYNFAANEQPTGTRVCRVNTIWRWTDWWQVRFEGCPSWTQVGGISAPKNNSWCAVDITNMYNDWKSGKYPNYGFCLDAGGVSNKWDKFYSSNYMDDPSLRPKLVITTSSIGVITPIEIQNFLAAQGF